MPDDRIQDGFAGRIRSLTLPVPPLRLQEEFIRNVAAVDAITKLQRESTNAAALTLGVLLATHF